MVPIILRDTFYLIDNMTTEEVFKIIQTEGLKSNKIRAKAIFQLPANYYYSSRSLIKSFVPDVTMGFYEVGNSFVLKPFDVNDQVSATYILGPNAEKYTCEEDYYSLNPSKELETSKEEQVTEEEQSTTEEEVVEAKPKETDEVVIEEVTGSVGYTAEEEEKLNEAEFLDQTLSKYPPISAYVQESRLMDVASYLSASKEDLDREVKIPFLKEANILNIIDGNLGNDVVDNTVGSSNNLLDSLLTFPVFSALVGKKRLTDRFSLSALEGAQFVRICPIGVSPAGDLYGFVHLEELSSTIISRVENEIKEELKADGRAFNKLTSQEKYQLFEEKLADYYMRNSGKMLMANGSRKYVNIVDFLNKLVSKKRAVPQVYDENEGVILWPSHEIITFDNRGEKTLKEQLISLYNKEPQKETETVQITEQTQKEKEDAFFAELSANLEKQLGTIQGLNTLTQPQANIENLNLNNTVVEPVEEEATEEKVEVEETDKEKETAPVLTLFDSLVNFSGTGKVGKLTLHDSAGTAIKDIEVRKGVSAPPTQGPLKVGTIDSNVVLGSMTMGGVDPTKPTKYVDEDGREWISKEARDKVMEAIFGASEEEEVHKKK